METSPDPTPSPEAFALKAAWSAYRAGQYAEAKKLYAQVLAGNPDQPQALVFLDVMRRGTMAPSVTPDRDNQFAALLLYNVGKAHQDRNHDESAIDLFQQCLTLDPSLLEALNDLGVSLNRAEQSDAAVDAFDQALLIAPDNAIIHGNRAVALAEIGHVDSALAAFREATRLNPNAAEIWMQYGLACLKFEIYGAAEEAFRNVLAFDSANEDAHINLIQALDRNHRLRAAEQACADWARRQSVVVRPCSGRPEARILIVAGASLCNTPVKFLLSADRFETVTVYLLPDSHDDVLAKIPAVDVVFNAIGDADRGAPFLKQAAALAHSVDCPVLNPPEGIIRTRRDLMPSLLSGIPGLILPEATRMTLSELKGLSTAPWATARIIRPVGLHNGHDLKLITDAADLAAYIAHVPVDEFYVTEYCDYVSADGYYRKYKFIFVDGEVFPYHLAISKHWLIHYWRANMDREQWLKREEEMFLADFRTVFSAPQVDTIKEVAARLKLDYAGLDCAIAPDGRVLFFEANANMLVHLYESRQDFLYKHEYVPRIFDAMGRLVKRRAAEKS